MGWGVALGNKELMEDKVTCSNGLKHNWLHGCLHYFSLSWYNMHGYLGRTPSNSRNILSQD
jgi:hypothetical protein